MARCYQCHGETELHIAGFAICLKCADSASAETPEMVRQRLELEQLQALEEHRQALARFEQAAAQASEESEETGARREASESNRRAHHLSKISHERYRRTHRLIMGYLHTVPASSDPGSKSNV
jgi:hypothetical protein